MTATALSLVKGTIGFVVNFYEIADKLDDKIEQFCRLAPILTEFDAAYTNRSPAVHDLLEQLFDAMLQFHLEVIRDMKQGYSAKMYTKEVFTGKMSDKISSFNSILDSLRAAIGLNNIMLTQRVVDNQAFEETARLIQELLIGQEAETLLRNDLDDREDKACEWVIQAPEYQHWHGLSEVQCLALVDNSGFGKSVSTAYLASHLSRNRELVYSYHLNQDINTPDIVYRGLLHQMLTKCLSLESHYLHWRKNTLKNETIATCSRKTLREFLIDCLRKSETVPYLILDGLDECLLPCQQEFHRLFAELHKTKAPIKLFISSSSSFDNQFLPFMPKLEIAVDKSKNKDLLVAMYWTQKYLDGRELSLKTCIANYLAKQAQGCSLWIKLAVEYLNRFKVFSESDFQKAKIRLPSSREIVKMYYELFQKVTDKIPENQEQLQRGLELLAVAGRAITITELHCAVQVSLEPSSFTDMVNLAKIENTIKLHKLIEPFVAKTQSNELRLSHQSLRTLLLQSLPDEWQDQEGRFRELSTNHLREEDTNYYMYLACTKSMLLCKQYPRQHIYDPFENMSIDPFGDENIPDTPRQYVASPKTDSAEHESEPLFLYAAKYWISHLSHIYDAERIDYSDIIELCRKGAPLTQSWYGEYAYKWGEGYFPYGVDPLQVVARFGSHAIILKMASLYSPEMLHVSDSVSSSIATLMDRGMTNTILELFKSTKHIGKCLRQVSIFYTIIHSWSKDDIDKPYSKGSDWNSILEYLIQQLHEDLLENANDILRCAARQGCLPMVQKLFEVADVDARLRAALLRHDQKLTKCPGLYEHQSVGQAAYWGHKNTVRFLCDQKGIESHIQYVNHFSRTVFHQAERLSDFETVSILYQKWPEGISKLDKNEESLLHLLCFRAGKVSCPKLIQDLVNNKLLPCDIQGPNEGTPLAIAVRGANLELCQFLTRHGADIEEVVGINQHGQVELKAYSDGGQEILTELGQLYLRKNTCKAISLTVA